MMPPSIGNDVMFKVLPVPAILKQTRRQQTAVAYDLTAAPWKEGFVVGRDSIIVYERMCGCTKCR